MRTARTISDTNPPIRPHRLSPYAHCDHCSLRSPRPRRVMPANTSTHYIATTSTRSSATRRPHENKPHMSSHGHIPTTFNQTLKQDRPSKTQAEAGPAGTGLLYGTSGWAMLSPSGGRHGLVDGRTLLRRSRLMCIGLLLEALACSGVGHVWRLETAQVQGSEGSVNIGVSRLNTRRQYFE